MARLAYRVAELPPRTERFRREAESGRLAKYYVDIAVNFGIMFVLYGQSHGHQSAEPAARTDAMFAAIDEEANHQESV